MNEGPIRTETRAPARRKCILVLGMHRSGTSAMTRVLNLLGAALPKHLLGANPSNEAGHWEPERLVLLNDRMLAEAGTRWDDWRAFDPVALGATGLGRYKAEIARLITDEYGDAALFVIKDPRICRFVRLYEGVLESLDVAPLYVLPFRNPLAVVKSLASRDGVTAPFASLLWLRHVLDAEQATRGKPRAIVSYERFIEDWQRSAFKIRDCLNVLWPLPMASAAEGAEAFLNRELTHHSPSLEELGARADIAEWIKEAHGALLALEQDHGSKEALETLDNVRAAFTTAVSVFGNVVFHELSEKASKFAEQTNKLNQELIARDADLSRQQSEMGILRQRLAEQDARIAGLDQALAAHAGEAASLRELVVARDQQIVRLDQILAARTDEAATLRQLVASRDRQLAEADQAIVDYRKQVDPLRGELAQLMRQTDALRVREAEKDAKLKSFEVAVVAIHRSTSWRMTSPLRAVGMILRRLYYSRFGYPLALARCFLTTRAPVRDWLAVHTVARSSLFDREWYSKTYPDVAARGIDPVRHYIASGAREGRDPSLHFSTRSYLSQNPDVAAAGINPLFHYIRYGAAEGRAGRSSLPTPPIESPANSTLRVSGAKTPPFEQKRSDARGSEEVGGSHEALAADCKLLRDSGIFDDAAYRAAARIAPEADAVEHYLLEGWHVGFEPGPDYDGASLYPYYRSVGYIGAPAITHLKLRASGAPAYASLEDAEHWAAAIRGSDLFNAAEYAARLDLAEELDPGLHYVVVGEHMGYPPSDAFDSKYYRERYPDIARSGINAFAHYVGYGRHEGRRPASIADKLAMDRSRLDARRETVLLVVHEASRTGAPILAWNIAVQLRHRYNVVALFIRGGELLGNFEDCCAAVVGPVGDPDWQPIEGEYIVRRLLDSYSITYAIANSIVSRLLVPALAGAFVPVVSLIHEFASYTRPKEVMREGLDWSTQVVFSSDVTAESAKSEHPHLVNRTIHVRPQGRCEVPRATKAVFSAATPNLREVFRPSGWEDALVVLGAGFVHIRKGVDLFLACAAAVSALNLKRPVRFIWIGSGYDLVDDPGYSAYLAEQIARSGLEGIVAIVDAVEDLEPAYAMSDVFFLSSRLDPLPNVTIDAAYHGLPIVCFDKASGMAALLSEEILLRSCVVPHLNVDAAAHVIAQFANDEKMRAETGNAIRRFAETNFDMERYVNRLDELGRSSIPVMRQRAEDFTTIRDDPLFDDDVFRQPNEKISSRDHAIMEFLTLWAAVGCGKAGVRRPAAGFHPQIYAHENSDRYDIAAINPLAHFLRSGKPKGPWLNDIITPPCEVKQREIGEANSARLRVGIHAHFYYPELITEFLSKVSCNRLPCDLLLTTDDFEKADNLRDAAAQYCRGEVIIRIVPNRGRDFGPLLTALAKDVTERYDVIGHFHGKRSFAVDGAMGEIWREFLWQNLIGERHPMMDVIVERFSRDAKLGLVFPSDPYLCGWDDNRAIADDLAKRIGIKASLPDFFDFPVGTMFWARVDALKPLFDLQVGWKDYPKEPLPIDGTTLHALERLLPFVVRHTGYRFATTHVPGVTR